jgi:hypothetical protein
MLIYSLASFAPPQPAVANLIEICTAHGIVTIPQPAENGAPATPGMPDCPACALTASATAPVKAVAVSIIVVPQPAPRACTVGSPDGSSRRHRAAISAHRTRAPPLPA